MLRVHLLPLMVLSLLAPAAVRAQQASAPPALDDRLIDVALHAVPWDSLCGTPDTCRALRVDSAVYVARLPFLQSTDSVAFVLSHASVARMTVRGHTVIAGGQEQDHLPPSDTAFVSLGVFRDPQRAPDERHVLVQVLPPKQWPVSVNCIVRWTGTTWRLEGIWIDTV